MTTAELVADLATDIAWAMVRHNATPDQAARYALTRPGRLTDEGRQAIAAGNHWRLRPGDEVALRRLRVLAALGSNPDTIASYLTERGVTLRGRPLTARRVRRELGAAR